MRCQIFLTLVLAAVSHADLDAPQFLEYFGADLSANIDGLIDENIESIRGSLKDPAELKDKKLGLTRHIFFHLENGFTQKVSQLSRSGPCTLSYENKTLGFEGNFAWDDLDFNYDYSLQVLFFKKNGVFLGSLKEVNVNIVLDVDLKNHQVTLQKFSFTNAGKVNLRVEGHRLGDKIFNLVLRFWTRVGKWSVLGKIQNNAADSIRAGIDELNEILGRENEQRFTFVNRAVQVMDVDSVDLHMI